MTPDSDILADINADLNSELETGQPLSDKPFQTFVSDEPLELSDLPGPGAAPVAEPDSGADDFAAVSPVVDEGTEPVGEAPKRKRRTKAEMAADAAKAAGPGNLVIGSDPNAPPSEGLSEPVAEVATEGFTVPGFVPAAPAPAPAATITPQGNVGSASVSARTLAEMEAGRRALMKGRERIIKPSPNILIPQDRTKVPRF